MMSEHKEENDEERNCGKETEIYLFEEALEQTGAFGLYQFCFGLTMQLVMVLTCGNTVFMAYSTYLPKVHCFVHNDTEKYVDIRKEKELFCQQFLNNNCSSLLFEAPFHTIIAEWNLLCNLDYIPEFLNSVQVFGTFIGLSLTGYLSDNYGRKWVFYLSFCILTAATVSAAIVPSWELFAVSRFVVGTTTEACCSLIFVWGMEQTDQRNSVLLNLASHWPIAYMITAAIAKVTADWRLYLWTLVLVAIPPLFAFPLMFVESPRWLIQHHRFDEAADSLKSMANANCKESSEISARNLQRIIIEKAGRSSVLRLFSNRRIAFYIVLVSLQLIAGGLAGGTFVFEISRLEGSPFVKFFLYGCLRVLVSASIFLVDRYCLWFGRRQMTLFPMAAMTVCFGGAYVVSAFGKGEQSNFVFDAILIGAACCNYLWVAVGQYSVELFPTNLRSSATNFIAVTNVASTVFLPLWIYLEDRFVGLPFLLTSLAGALALASASAFLPETKGKFVPDTVEDVMKIEDVNLVGNNELMRRKRRCVKKTETGDDVEAEQLL